MSNTKKGVFVVAIVGLLCCFLPAVWRAAGLCLYIVLALIASRNSIDDDVAQRSGCERISQVRQIETLLGKGDHFIAYGKERFNVFRPGDVNDIYQWSTDVYFAGRYQLMMWADIEVDRHSSEVLKIIGTPKFRFLEIKTVDMSGGSPNVSYRSSAQRDFSAADWEKVVEAQGDFALIGIQIRNDAPIPNFEELVKWSQSHRQQR